MLIFVIVALTIYTAMHLLVFWGMHPLLARHRAVPTLAWLLMVPMILAPFALRMLERFGYDAAARALAWTGYTWMGFLFIAFSMVTVIALWEVISFLLSKIISPLPHLSLRSPQSAALIFIITLTAGIYGLHEGREFGLRAVVHLHFVARRA